MRRALFVLILVLSTPMPGVGQVVVNDLVITAGVAGEDYSGNLSAVTIAVVDSTQDASAAVGEFSGRLDAAYFFDQTRSLSLTVDLGLRQFAATGFKIRDYAPREWVGRVDAAYFQALSSWGSLTIYGGYKGRAVNDRPPMPLFLQPGYNQYRGGVTLGVGGGDVRFDVGVRGQIDSYRSLKLVPQLDMLDRESAGIEVGIEVAQPSTNWRLRVFGVFEGSRYPSQPSFDEADPFRRDETIRTGALWTYTGSVIAAIGVEGTLNRSNSARPEYNAASLRGELTAPLPWDMSITLFTTVTQKDYLFETEFARLVPGEEADNASVAYITLARPLASNLDGRLRFGWTRAETDIGNSYYERYGVTFLFDFRPHL
ncbi:MAG: hypothetical protein ACC667_01750 [Longimicrobiales bacterium]